MTSSLKETIYRLEELLLQPEIRKSPEKLADLLAGDFREFGSSGEIYEREDIIESLATEDSAKFAISDFQVKELSQDVVLATYRVSKTVTRSNMTTYSLRSSIWKKSDDRWQMIFHQGTMKNMI